MLIDSSTSSFSSETSTLAARTLRWYASKPLHTATSAINNSVALDNRLSQTLTIKANEYTIGRIACYLARVRTSSQPLPPVDRAPSSSTSTAASISSSTSTAVSISSSSTRIEHLQYSSNGSAITITGFNDSPTQISIPDTINDLPVTTIGDYAFATCLSLTSIAIPNTVTSIGSDAFYHCIGLTGVTIPNSVTILGEYAFSGCSRITSVTIGSAVNSIGRHVFENCFDLTNVTIPNSVTSLGDRAFQNCGVLTAVYFEGNAPTLGSEVFAGDDSLTIYYNTESTGFTDPWGDKPTAPMDLVSSTSSSNSSSLPYQIHLEIWTASDSGTPLAPLAMPNDPVVLKSDSINAAGWYFFDVGMTVPATTPANQKLAFVLYQDGGDEDDYVVWFYSPDSGARSAYWQNNGTDWQLQPDAIRSLVALDEQDIFAQAYAGNYEHAISTAPGSLGRADSALDNGEFTQTELNNENHVVLGRPPLALSLVVDTSGSMGWSDRNARRTALVRKVISHMSSYPADVVYDIVSFGGQSTGATAGGGSGGAVGKRNIMLTAARKYDRDGNLVENLVDDPALAKVVSYGFRSLKPGHTYRLSSIETDTLTLEDGQGLTVPAESSSDEAEPAQAINFQNVGPSGAPVLFAVTKDGPAGASCISVAVPAGADVSTQFRKPLGANRPLQISFVTDDTPAGGSPPWALPVEDSSPFAVGGYVDIIDRDHTVLHWPLVAAIAAEVGSSSSSTGPSRLLLGEALPYDVHSAANQGGFVQESPGLSIDLSTATALSVLLMDEQSDGAPVILYLETADGYRFDLDIIPFSNYTQVLLGYLGSGVPLNLTLHDANNLPVADGTEVAFFVDNRPANPQRESTIKEITLRKTPQTNAERLYLSPEEATKIQLYSLITLKSKDTTSSSTLQHTVIAIDKVNGWVDITPPLEELTFAPYYLSVAPPPGKSASRGGVRSPMTLSAVDVTPMVTQRSLNWQPGDPPPVPPDSLTESNLNRYNQDPGRRLDNSFEVPAIWDGDSQSAIAAIRVLPVTVDSLGEPNLAWLNPPPRQEDTYDAPPVISSSSEEQVGSFSSQSSESDVDYIIRTPVYTIGGLATSEISTTSRKLSWTSLGDLDLSYDSLTGQATIDRLIGRLVKSYSIYPYLQQHTATGDLASRQALLNFSVNFASPYILFSSWQQEPDRIGQAAVRFELGNCVSKDADTGEVSETAFEAHGPYAASSDGFYIDYLLVDHEAPLRGNATLNIRVYDAHRSEADMDEPEKVQPNLTSEVCVMVGEYPAEVAPKYHRRPYSQSPAYFDTITMAEATYLPDYPVGGYVLTLQNGQARLNLPALTRVSARLVVVAVFTFPENTNQSVIKKDYVWYRSPLSIRPLIQGSPVATAMTLSSGYDLPPYPVSAEVTWLGADAPDNFSVAFVGSPHNRFLSSPVGYLDPSLDKTIGQAAQKDNQLRSYATKYGSWPATPFLPSVARITNGVCSEVLLGPHGPVTNHWVKQKDGSLLEAGDQEVLRFSTRYDIWTATAAATIEWVGAEPVSTLEEFNYLIRLLKAPGGYGGGGEPSPEASCYADGWDSVAAMADLPASLEWGLLDNATAANLIGRKVTFTKYGSLRWQADPPADPWTAGARIPSLSDNGGEGYAVTGPIRQVAFIDTALNVGPIGGSSTPVCKSPACWTVNSYTFGQTPAGYQRGEGCAASQPGTCYLIPEVDIQSGTVSPPQVTPAMIYWQEPLQATFLVGGLSPFSLSTLKRDGVSTTEIWVDVTFSGQALPLVARANHVQDENGNDLPLPQVVFDAYRLDKNQQPVRDESILLENYLDTVSVRLTSNANGHYHTCSVDNDGNGLTTGTLSEGGLASVEEHVHEISNFVVQVSDGHAHSVRSVARTTILPVSDLSNTLCVTARLQYDASNPVFAPVQRVRTFTFTDTPSAVSGDTDEIGYTMTLTGPDDALATLGVDSSQSGFTVQAEIQKMMGGEVQDFSEADGLRVRFDLSAWRPPQADDGKFTSWELSADGTYLPAPYIEVKVNAGCLIGGKRYTGSTSVPVGSNQPWVPKTFLLTPEPTGDAVYLDAAIERLSLCFGPSPLHDAAKSAAARLIQWQSNDSARRHYRKAVLLLTDGWENHSESTIDDAITRIQHVDGQTTCSPVVFGYPSGSGDLILRQYAAATNSIVTPFLEDNFPAPGSESSTSSRDEVALPAFVAALFTNALATLNSGSYNNIIDLETPSSWKSVRLTLSAPANTSLVCRVRFSDDAENWNAWSEYQTFTTTGDLDLGNVIYRYMQYWVAFYGNDSFGTPILQDVFASMVIPRSHQILFAPIATDAASDEGVCEVVVSHQVTSESHSTIRYGITAADTIEARDYYSVDQPQFTAGRRQVMLSRANEPVILNTEAASKRAYRLLNGAWPEGATLEIYDLGADPQYGSLVPATDYAANPTTGEINFIVAKSGPFSATILWPPSFRLWCKIVNYSNWLGDAVKVHSVAVTWNLTKRLPSGFRGILRLPIGDVIENSSSS